eukprot:132961_1
MAVTMISNFIIPFSTECKNGSCLRCDVGGKITCSLATMFFALIGILFLQLSKVYHRGPKTKYWLIAPICCLIVLLIFVNCGQEFEIKALKDNKNQFICVSKPVYSMSFEWRLLCSFGILSMLIFVIMSCISFVVYTFKHIQSIGFYKQITVEQFKQ